MGDTMQQKTSCAGIAFIKALQNEHLKNTTWSWKRLIAPRFITSCKGIWGELPFVS